jgi:hypothetical protein
MYSTLIPLVLVGSFMVGGCASSSPTKTARQYCYTSKDITVKNGEKVDSTTQVRCNDDPIETIPTVKMGISPKCFENPYRHQLPSGRVVEGMNYVCQKRDGSWEIIDGRGINSR